MKINADPEVHNYPTPVNMKINANTAGHNNKNSDDVQLPDSEGLNANLEMYDYGEDFDCGNVTEDGKPISGKY